tara:strand:+ start:455 stop:652 length:198 start_codon:yes stop_codon:yes gene_type:complete
MIRKYGDEQRKAVAKIKEELIDELEKTYLLSFEKLNEAGLGDGVIVKLTQLFLMSKDAAVSVLNN